MAAINTKNVHRTNALRGHPWGRDFVYDERMLTGDGERGEKRARGRWRAHRASQNALLSLGLTRALLRRFALPKPGAGPEARAARDRPLRSRFHRRDGGWANAARSGEGRPRSRLRLDLQDDRGERAVPGARGRSRRMTRGGVWTPGAAHGPAAGARLQERAGLSFAIED